MLTPPLVLRAHPRAVLACAVIFLTVFWAACGGSSDSPTNTPPINNNPVAVAPTLSGISPATGSPGSTPSVTLTGANFVSGATSVSVSGAGVSASNVSVSGTTSLSASFVIDAAAALGARNISVTTAAGTSGSQTFTINPPAPTLTTIAPSSGTVGATVPVTLTGTNFVSGATVAVSGTGVTVGTVTVASATSLTTSLVIGAAATAGARNVTVTTAGGTSTAQNFTVNAPVVSPNSWHREDDVRRRAGARQSSGGTRLRLLLCAGARLARSKAHGAQ